MKPSAKVRDILHHDSLVSVHEDTPVGELDRILASNQFGGVPVVSDSGRLVGTVSQSDIIRLISKAISPVQGPGEEKTHMQRVLELERELREKRAKDIMERRVHYVSPTDEITSVARTMRRRRVHRVPVVDHGRLIGILTAFDLIQFVEDPNFFAEYYGEKPGRR